MLLYFRSKYPEKSIFVGLYNILLMPLRMLHLGPYKYADVIDPINIKKMMQVVKKHTNLGDYGDLSFVESYQYLQSSKFYLSKKLTNIGYILANMEMFTMLSRRLKVIFYLKNTPSILSLPVNNPVFVTGMSHTGLIFLHKLLALDTTSRAPLLWELLQPVPEVKDGAPLIFFQRDREKRKKSVEKQIQKRKFLGEKDELSKYRELEYDQPDECMLCLADETPVLLHQIYSFIMNWEYFLIKQPDCLRAYAWYKKILQILSYQTGDHGNEKRWLLKSPLHGLMIPSLAATFPDAKIIWVHRHPATTITALCGLVRASHNVYFDSNSLDSHEMGRKTSEMYSHIIRSAPEEIKQAGLHCVDVLYENLLKDPLTIVKHIYKQFHWDFTEQYAQKLENFLHENRIQKQIKETEIARRKRSNDNEDAEEGQDLSEEVLQQYDKYDLRDYADELHADDFGLDTSALSEDAFKEYIDRFNIHSTK